MTPQSRVKSLFHTLLRYPPNPRFQIDDLWGPLWQCLVPVSTRLSLYPYPGCKRRAIFTPVHRSWSGWLARCHDFGGCKEHVLVRFASSSASDVNLASDFVSRHHGRREGICVWWCPRRYLRLVVSQTLIVDGVDALFIRCFR